MSDLAATRRERALGVAAYAFAVAVGLLALFSALDDATTEHAEALATGDTYISPALVIADVLAGALCIVALHWRKRWPVGVAFAMAPAYAFSTMAGGAAIVAIYGLALRRPPRALIPVLALYVLLVPVYLLVRPEVGLGDGIFTVVSTAAIVCFGMYVRARRELLRSLAERAERAEAEQQLRVEQAEQLERTRIAREMHDVLGHRLSLLSLQAGALEYAGDVGPEETARAAAVIRESAHQALEDLRTVVGVLRDGDDAEPVAGGPEPPQPTLAELPDLVDESRRAGMRLDAQLAVADLGGVPMAVGRHAYRVVQEGLTNARKHAEHSPVALRVEGAAGAGLEIELRNRMPNGAAPAGRDGVGLLGLDERAALAGGRLEHGATPGGDFRLWAWFPWPA